MNEGKKLTYELLRNTLSNFILYLIIFSLFSGFLYYQVSSYLYSTANDSLNRAKNDWSMSKERQEFEERKRAALNSIYGTDNIQKDTESNNDSKESSNTKNSTEKQNESEKKMINESIDEADKLGVSDVRVIAIERTSDGEIKANSLVHASYLKYFSDINFDEEKLNETYEILVNNKFYYKAINAKYVTKEGETTYVQLLINIDSEKQMIQTFTKSLLSGSVIIIVIMLFTTFVLTRRAMAPIIANYEKQVEFVQNASHELRTPLTIIQAKQEMLLKSPNSKIIDKSEDIALTLSETRRITKLVKELMELARADASKDSLNKELLDLNQVITEVAKPYIEMSSMQGKTLELELNCLKECNADRSKITQLLVILLDNALKYTEENDTITICSRNKEDKCFIEVKDTGIGISDEAIKHIFERFYREDKARSREKGGSGLGLSIAKNIVEMHGGNIKAVHNKPKGTIFIVKL